MIPSWTITLSVLSTLAASTTIPWRCDAFKVRLNIEAEAYALSGVPRFTNSYEAQALLLELTSRDAPQDMSFLLGETRNLKTTVKVYAQYCTPAKGSNGIVQVLSHGLGEDHSYV